MHVQQASSVGIVFALDDNVETVLRVGERDGDRILLDIEGLKTSISVGRKTVKLSSMLEANDKSCERMKTCC